MKYEKQDCHGMDCNCATCVYILCVKYYPATVAIS